MIRLIDIRLNAAHPELPLAEAVTYTGAPSTVLIRGVPGNCGRWAITGVYVAASYPDGSTTTRAAVQSANGVWVATIPATATSGRTTNGLRIMADGEDENGDLVTGYVLGVADFAVASLAVTPAPEPGATSWQMLYFDTVPGTPRKGDVANVNAALSIYNGTAWEAFDERALAAAEAAIRDASRADAKAATANTKAVAAQGAINTHAANTTIHVTATDKATWNGKQNALTAQQLANIAAVPDKLDNSGDTIHSGSIKFKQGSNPRYTKITDTGITHNPGLVAGGPDPATAFNWLNGLSDHLNTYFLSKSGGTLTGRGFTDWVCNPVRVLYGDPSNPMEIEVAVYKPDYYQDVWALSDLGSAAEHSSTFMASQPYDSAATSLTFTLPNEFITRTVTAAREALPGYILGPDEQTNQNRDKPLASEAEAEALRTGKANRAPNPTEGNLAALDAQGNLTDSGIAAGDLLTIIALTDGTETMAQLATRLATLATSGITAYFDTSAITTTPQSKLVSAIIDATAGKIRFDDKLTGRIYIGPYDATMTLATVLSRMVESYVYLAVTATTLDGATVTGQTVSLYEGTDAATGRLVETAAYNGSPVTFMVPRNMEYFISITSTLAQHFQPNTLQGTASASASLTITYQDVSNITDYAGLVAFKNVVEADSSITDKAAYLENAVLGKEIADTFTATNGTVYDNPMVVVGANYYTGEDNQQHLGLMMQRKWASSYDTQFDAAEGVECDSATETTAEAGISYYGLAIGETSKTAANLTLLELATGATLPYSDYAKIYKCAIRDTTRNILQYGYNNWRDSAYRQHLNSSAAAGAWWAPTHVGDAAPSNLNSVRGYKAGCSAALLAAAKPIYVKTWPNYTTDGANNLGTVYETLDTFFLPSGVEVYANVNMDGVYPVEGPLSEYWKIRTGLENPSTKAVSTRIMYRELPVGSTANRSAAGVRLRSTNRGFSNYVWFVNASGQVNGSNYAYTAYASVPACVIY